MGKDSMIRGQQSTNAVLLVSTTEPHFEAGEAAILNERQIVVLLMKSRENVYIPNRSRDEDGNCVVVVGGTLLVKGFSKKRQAALVEYHPGEDSERRGTACKPELCFSMRS